MDASLGIIIVITLAAEYQFLKCNIHWILDVLILVLKYFVKFSVVISKCAISKTLLSVYYFGDLKFRTHLSTVPSVQIWILVSEFDQAYLSNQFWHLLALLLFSHEWKFDKGVLLFLQN